jgi:hypothetical protein
MFEKISSARTYVIHFPRVISLATFNVLSESWFLYYFVNENKNNIY